MYPWGVTLWENNHDVSTEWDVQGLLKATPRVSTQENMSLFRYACLYGGGKYLNQGGNERIFVVRTWVAQMSCWWKGMYHFCSVLNRCSLQNMFSRWIIISNILGLPCSFLNSNPHWRLYINVSKVLFNFNVIKVRLTKLIVIYQVNPGELRNCKGVPNILRHICSGKDHGFSL